MRDLLKQLYQGMARLCCRFYRQRLPFFAVAIVALSGFTSQAQIFCAKAHAAAFEFLQQESLRKFVDRYIEPQASYKKRVYNFGYTLVSDIHGDTQVYEFHPAGSWSSNRPEVSPDRQIISKSHLSEISLPQKQLEIRRDDGSMESYQITDVGYNLLSKDDHLLSEAFDRALSKRSGNEPFQIEYHRDYPKARRFLGMLHQWASLVVTNIYSTRKGYLSLSDLYSLREGDLSPESSDNYFVLQKSSGGAMTKQKYERFLDSTLAIIRLVRATRSSILVPRKYDDVSMNPYELPVVKRYMGTKIGNDLKNELYNIGSQGERKVGEISRFVRTTDFPEPLMDALMKNVFEAAIQPENKIDILLISVDKSTRRLFGKYRFQDLIPLTDPRHEAPEFLMYLDTGSSEFQEVLFELRRKAAAVREGGFESSVVVGLQEKYPSPPGWNKGSAAETYDLTMRRLRELRESDNRSKYGSKLSGLLMDLIGYLVPGRKVLIVSEQKEAIYEVLRPDIGPSFVTVVGLNELEKVQVRDFDQINFSGLEYEDRRPEVLWEHLKALASKTKKHAVLDVSLPEGYDNGISANAVAKMISSVPGTDTLGVGVRMRNSYSFHLSP